MNRLEKLNIIYEDKHIIVIDKESGLLTIGTAKEKENTLYHKVFTYLKKKNQHIYVVHRLDKDTSGLVLFAKSEKVKLALQSNWDKVIRKYYAITYGKNMPNDGTIEVKLSETKTLLTYVDSKDGKLAITKYTKLKSVGKYNLVDIELLTGRKNQIRVSLNHIGYPILGDKKYGKAPNPLRRLCLYAYLLDFIHPITKKHIKLELEMPKIFENIMK